MALAAVPATRDPAALRGRTTRSCASNIVCITDAVTRSKSPQVLESVESAPSKARLGRGKTFLVSESADLGPSAFRKGRSKSSLASESLAPNGQCKGFKKGRSASSLVQDSCDTAQMMTSFGRASSVSTADCGGVTREFSDISSDADDEFVEAELPGGTAPPYIPASRATVFASPHPARGVATVGVNDQKSPAPLRKALASDILLDVPIFPCKATPCVPASSQTLMFSRAAPGAVSSHTAQGGPGCVAASPPLPAANSESEADDDTMSEDSYSTSSREDSSISEELASNLPVDATVTVPQELYWSLLEAACNVPMQHKPAGRSLVNAGYEDHCNDFGP